MNRIARNTSASRIPRFLKSTCLVLAFCAAMTVRSSAQFKPIANFAGSNGSYPQYVSLVQGTDGNLYGTTETGGLSRFGTVFRVSVSGTITSIYSFCAQGDTCPDGAYPYAGLLLGTDGAFYGTTWGNELCSTACGTVFKVTRNGVLTTLHTFALTDGANPAGALTQGTDGDLYGTTEYGGSGDCTNLYVPGCGTIFKISSKLGFTTLHSFTGADGWNPLGGVIQGTDGNFYGTTAAGGSYGGGTIFRITPEGKLTTLYSFCAQANCTDGQTPTAALLQASDGNFYGTTESGGIYACYYGELTGTAFKMTPAGTLTTIYNFCDGRFPTAPLIAATDGNLYGTTSVGGAGSYCYGVFTPGCGTVFKLAPTGVLTILHYFCSEVNCGDGAGLYGGLIQHTNGLFYGSTIGGGAGEEGTVFRLSGGLGPFIAFVQATAKVGKSAQILGQGLTGTSSVTFNGVEAASFKVLSDTYMTAVVPQGASTGPVVVTTPGGTLKSNQNFRIVH